MSSNIKNTFPEELHCHVDLTHGMLGKTSLVLLLDTNKSNGGPRFTMELKSYYVDKDKSSRNRKRLGRMKINLGLGDLFLSVRFFYICDRFCLYLLI